MPAVNTVVRIVKHRLRPAKAASHGFTLIELMVTLAIMVILTAIALPSFSTFMAENRAKSKAAQLAAAIQSAQFDAFRRNREVLFTLTSSTKPSSSLTGNSSGKNWASVALPLPNSDSNQPEVISVGGYTENGADVTLSASSAGLCFLPNGSLKVNTDTKVTGASCAVTASGAEMRVDASRGGKSWQVSVSPFGKISMCMGTVSSSNVFTCS